MTATRTTWTARHATSVLPIKAGTISIDELNVPAITASIIMPYDAELHDALDPRTTSVPRLQIQGRRTSWASQTAASLTALIQSLGATTAGDLSALWVGKTVADITAMFGVQTALEDAGGTTDRMDLSLHVRSVRHDLLADTLVVDLASDEALLTDWGVSSIWDLAELSTWAQSFNLERASAWANLMLGAVFGSRLTPGPYDTDPLSDSFESSILDSVGASAYDMMRPALEDANLKLRVSPDGRSFSLRRPEDSLNSPSTHTFTFSPRNVIGATMERSRNGDWYDSAMLTEEGIGGGFGYPRGEHSRTYREHLPEGSGLTESAAENIVTRARNRGQFFDVVAPIRPGVFMRDYFYWQPDPEQPGEQWQVQGVSFDLITDTMRIRGVQPY